jgi:2-polyprenyl-6-hydroxyphenyl methylase/3-demethylubiquinone-9 3-methyltransferase
MWQALRLAADRVAPKGRLCIAIYNDQGRASRMWLQTKRAYNALPSPLRWLVLWPATLRLWGPTMIRDLFAGRPFATWHNYGTGSRGMDPWRDVVDWVGGLPFEVAKPEEVFYFLKHDGFRLERLRTCAGGHGCNEYVFVRER